MKKIVGLSVLITWAMVTPVQAQLEGLDAERFYVGAGLTFNSLPDVGSARGLQLIGGYEFEYKINDDITSALEIGLMDTGDFESINKPGKADDVSGLWISTLQSVPLSSKTDMLARLGYDFGDDDGLLLGMGMQYKFDTKVALRMEYIAREHMTSLQVNVRFKFR